MSLNGDAGPQPGRIVLITGANRGLGRETASQLARLGMHVVIGSRDREAGQATAQQLTGSRCTAGPSGNRLPARRPPQRRRAAAGEHDSAS